MTIDSYFPLVWMCHSRANHIKINKLPENCLHIIYTDKTSSFVALLEKNGSVSIHNRNLQLLPIGMYEASKALLRQL